MEGEILHKMMKMRLRDMTEERSLIDLASLEICFQVQDKIPWERSSLTQEGLMLIQISILLRTTINQEVCVSNSKN